jgi:hypothetical protein
LTSPSFCPYGGPGGPLKKIYESTTAREAEVDNNRVKTNAAIKRHFFFFISNPQFPISIIK